MKGRKVLAGLVTLAIAGGAVAGAASAAMTVGSKDLVGKTWLLTSLAKKPPVPGTSVTMVFSGGKVSGSAGCNTYSAPYKAGAVSLEISGPMSMTRMACKPAVSAQEAAFVKTLSSVKRYTVRGDTLTLRGTLKELATFEAQSQDLAGTAWKVVSYNNGKQAVVSVLAGSKLTAAFGSDDTVSGNAGCNTYNGKAEADAPKIAIGPLASTRKACAEPAGVMEQETAFLAALQSAATYAIQGSKLELRTASGALAVQLTK